MDRENEDSEDRGNNEESNPDEDEEEDEDDDDEDGQRIFKPKKGYDEFKIQKNTAKADDEYINNFLFPSFHREDQEKETRWAATDYGDDENGGGIEPLGIAAESRYKSIRYREGEGETIEDWRRTQPEVYADSEEDDLEEVVEGKKLLKYLDDGYQKRWWKRACEKARAGKMYDDLDKGKTRTVRILDGVDGPEFESTSADEDVRASLDEEDEEFSGGDDDDVDEEGEEGEEEESAVVGTEAEKEGKVAPALATAAAAAGDDGDRMLNDDEDDDEDDEGAGRLVYYPC
jgi:hypothetical protein